MQRIWQAVMVLLTLGACIAVNTWRYPIVRQMVAHLPAWEFSLQPKQSDSATATLPQNPPPPLSTVQSVSDPASGPQRPPSPCAPQTASLPPYRSGSKTPEEASAFSVIPARVAPERTPGPPPNVQSPNGRGDSSVTSPPEPRTSPSHESGNSLLTPKGAFPHPSSETQLQMVSGEKLQRGLPMVPLDTGPLTLPGSLGIAERTVEVQGLQKPETGGSLGQGDCIQRSTQNPPIGGVSTTYPPSSSAEITHSGDTAGKNSASPMEPVSCPASSARVCTGSVCFVGSPRPRITQIRPYPRSEPEPNLSALNESSSNPNPTGHVLAGVKATVAGSSSSSEDAIELLPPVDSPMAPPSDRPRFPWPPDRVPFYPSTGVD